MPSSNDLYDVKNYTDKELLDILNLSNPTDRELEAKILHMIWKYENMDNTSSDKFVQFFKDTYDRFFEIEDDGENEEESYQEGMSNLKSKPLPPKEEKTTEEINQVRQLQYAFPVEYSKDYLNPLLKQTIKRNIVIDSQYRESKNYNNPTNFTFNLSEPLKDVVSLKLYSFQIPYTWYTINNNYGSNFFYLKGNKEGINSGNKDIKIEIPVGNYTSSDLVSTVNNSMLQSFQTQYSDISFGTTSIKYTSANSKATLTLDITNNYDELYYQIRFADPNLASFLGFNNVVYSPTNIISSIIFDYNIQDYLLTSKNNYFKIINYVNPTQNEYLDDLSNNTILNIVTIQLSLSVNYRYSRSELFKDLEKQIQNAKELQKTEELKPYSYIIFNSSSINGNYFELKLKTDRHYFNTIQNSKKVIFFPKGSDDDHDIWIDNVKGQSAFSFVNSSTNYSKDNDNNYYVELSSVISESSIVNNVPYVIGGLNPQGQPRDVYLDLLSNNPNLNSNINLKILKDLTVNTYTNIDEYMKSIDTDLKNIENYYDNNLVKQKNNINILTNTKISRDGNSCSNLNLQFINKIIDQSNYKILLLDGTCFTQNIIVTSPYREIERDGSNSYIIYPGEQLNYEINIKIENPPRNFQLVNNQKIMTITNINTNYHKSLYCENIDIYYNSNTGTDKRLYTIDDYMDEITSKIFNFNYTDSTKTKNNILYGSSYIKSLDYVINGTQTQSGSLYFNVNRFLTQNDYTLYFVDTFADMSKFDTSYCFIDPNNSWGNYLNYYSGTDISRNNVQPYPYHLNDPKISKSDNIKGTYAEIIGQEPTIDSFYSLSNDASSNHIYIEPVNDENGGEELYTSTSIIDIDLNGSKNYGYNNLLNIINTQINTHDILTNTNFSSISKDGNIKTKLRFNINNTYKTGDYVLAFYDPYYFTTCVFNRTVQNTTWDATLGWILGYRNLTQYNLSEITGIKSNPNIITLTGDTVVNVNLYNYFMIVLDDYNQNHLNDGLVTTSKRDTNTSLPSYANKAMFKCDTDGNTITTTIDATGEKNLTQKQIYAAQEIINANNNQENNITKSYFSSGPFTNDLFAVIPLKVSGIPNNGTYVDYGGSLQNQERVYFGPVNINRMNIKLINDRGEIVDLNNNDWSFSLICEQLYQQKKL